MTSAAVSALLHRIRFLDRQSSGHTNGWRESDNTYAGRSKRNEGHTAGSSQASLCRETLDPYRKCPDGRDPIEGGDLVGGALWIRAFEVSRWRGGYGNREAMGFESLLVGRMSVIGDSDVDRADEEKSGASRMVANEPFAWMLE